MRAQTYRGYDVSCPLFSSDFSQNRNMPTDANKNYPTLTEYHTPTNALIVYHILV